MLLTAIQNLFAINSSRNHHKSSTRLRPLLMALEGRQLLSTFVVNTTSDIQLPHKTTLRQAVEEANAKGGYNTITFSPLFDTPQRISIAYQLTVKHDFLTIDGPAAGLTISTFREVRLLAVESNAKVQASNLTFTGGQAISDEGGGVYNGGALTLTNCTVTNNRAESSYRNTYGGGVYNGNGKLTMVNCTISNNKAGTKDNSLADAWGGGIANYGGTVDLENCTINNNSAVGNFRGSSGGGLYNYHGNAFLTNCTFVGNTADDGGGMQNNGDAVLVSCTFTQNSAIKGGGIFLWKSLDILNTVVSGNKSLTKGPDVYGRVHSGGNDNPRGGNNLIGNTSESSGWVSTAAGGTDQTNIYAGLAALGDNGGPTQTVALYSNGAAFHNGTRVNYAGTNKPLLTDQRGLPLNTPPDIGAFQTQSR